METDKTTLSQDHVESAAVDAVDVAEIERLAEERGYLRGRNERIEELMAAPGVWQPLQAAERSPDQDFSSPQILQNLKGSIWD